MDSHSKREVLYMNEKHVITWFPLLNAPQICQLLKILIEIKRRDISRDFLTQYYDDDDDELFRCTEFFSGP